MIHTIDKALERFFRASVPLPEDRADVSFVTPDRTWGAAISKPTVNIFLWQVSRNQSRSTGGIEQRVSADGDIERRRKQPVVDLRYIATAWTTEPSDEHELLGAMGAAVLGYDDLPAEFLPPELVDCKVAMKLSTADPANANEFWSSLDGRMKPGLQLELSLPLQVFRWQSTSAPAEVITVGLHQFDRGNSAQSDTDQTDAEIRRYRSGGRLVMEGRRPQSNQPG